MISVSREEVKEAQRRDEVIGPVYQAVETGCRPTRKEWAGLSQDTRTLMRSYAKLELQDGVLLRKTVKYQQIVLPKSFHEMVYKELHVKMGHLGVEKVADLAQQRFYWPRMVADIKSFVQKKCRCVANKQPNIKERAPLTPIEAQYPFQMISIDFIKLDKCKGGYQYGMVAIDHFTRFCQFYATRNKSSRAAADKLFNEFILQFGFPERIHHDQGGEFNNRLFKELHRMTGIKSSNTTPYHPMGDGQVERQNRTLINMLKTLSKNEKNDWKKHFPRLAFACNSTRNKTTGFSPHFLMFGRESKLPIDWVFQDVEQGEIQEQTHEQFAVEWEKSMKQAYEIARENIGKSASYNKKYYDRKAKTVEISVGDLVLVKNVRERGGTGKLRSYWEEAIFKVTEVDEKISVYVLQNLKKSKDIRKLHRNKLMKVEELPVDTFDEPKPTKKTTTTKPTTKSTQKARPTEPMMELEEEESDDMAVLIIDRGPEAEDVVDDIAEEVVEEESAGEDIVEEEVVEEESAEEDAVAEVSIGSGVETSDGVENQFEGDSEQSEDGEPEQEGDDEFSSEETNSSSESEEEVRRSSRVKTRAHTFTYETVGGNPTIVPR